MRTRRSCLHNHRTSYGRASTWFTSVSKSAVVCIRACICLCLKSHCCANFKIRSAISVFGTSVTVWCFGEFSLSGCVGILDNSNMDSHQYRHSHTPVPALTHQSPHSHTSSSSHFWRPLPVLDRLEDCREWTLVLWLVSLSSSHDYNTSISF